MSNETKRDVFVRLAGDMRISDYFNKEYEMSQEDVEKRYKENIHNYDAALPDDLPVIPKTVGEILRSSNGQDDLLGVFEMAKNGHKVSEPLAWILVNQNTIARAWLLGVWRVEETGEIVKLEAEKRAKMTSALRNMLHD